MTEEIKQFINTVFQNTGLKLSEDDPILALMLFLQNNQTQLNLKNNHTTGQLLELLDGKINQLQEILDNFTKVRTEMIHQLLDMNQASINNQIQQSVSKQQQYSLKQLSSTKKLIIAGFSAIILLQPVVLFITLKFS